MASQLTNNVKFIVSHSKSFLYQKMTLSVPFIGGQVRVRGHRMFLGSRIAGNGRWHSLRFSGFIIQATTDLPKAPQTLFPALNLLELVKHTKVWLNKPDSVSRTTMSEQRLPV